MEEIIAELDGSNERTRVCAKKIALANMRERAHDEHSLKSLEREDNNWQENLQRNDNNKKQAQY